MDLIKSAFVMVILGILVLAVVPSFSAVNAQTAASLLRSHGYTVFASNTKYVLRNGSANMTGGHDFNGFPVLLDVTGSGARIVDGGAELIQLLDSTVTGGLDITLTAAGDQTLAPTSGSFIVDGTLALPDDTLLNLGNGADTVLTLRSTVLGSQTALAGVLVSAGANYHMKGLAADTLIIANTTTNGGILIAGKMTDGNSRPIIHFDGRYDQVRFGNYTGDREDAADTAEAYATWFFGSLEAGDIEGGHYYVVQRQRPGGATHLTFNSLMFEETSAPYAGDIVSHRSHVAISSGNSQNLTGTIIGQHATVNTRSVGSPTYAKAEGIRVDVTGSSFGTPTVTALSGLHVTTPTRLAGTWGTYTSLEIDDPGTTATTNYAVDVKGGTSWFQGRVIEAQGTDVASANDLTLGDSNSFEITGNTQINRIVNTGWTNGAEVTLMFSSTPTVKDNQASGGANIIILLDGSADFTASAGDMLILKLSEIGGVQAWREKSRTVL